jgi:hypothetical protein
MSRHLPKDIDDHASERDHFTGATIESGAGG